MIKPVSFFRILSLTILLTAAVILPVQANAHPQDALPELFSEADENPASENSDPVQVDAQGDPAPEVLRSRQAAVNFSILTDLARSIPRPGAPSFVLNLFEDAAYAATIQQVVQMDGGSVGVIGTVDSPEYNELVMVSRDGALQATLQVGGQTFEIRYTGGGHTIAEIDQSGYPDSLPPVLPDREPQPDQIDGDSVAALDSADEIDVLAIYTPAARAYLGGTSAVELRIQQSILSANTGYSNSGITQQLNLVGMEEVNYNETIAGQSNKNMWYYALDRLTFGRAAIDPVGSNYLADARAYRELYGADVVFMITDLPYTYCGLGWIGGSSGDANLAYSVVHRNCTGSSSYTIQHEMGHNMGACHDWDNTSTDILPHCYANYAHGHQVDYNFYTVMAYQSGCVNCSRINRWSNPNLIYNGAATGVPLNQTKPAFNALALNNTASTVANYRQAVSPITASFSDPAVNGRVHIPRAWLKLDASSEEGEITSVTFQAYYNGGWHTLGTDYQISDGWEIFWTTAGLSEQDIHVRAIITDSAANQKATTRAVLLSMSFVSVYGFESRAGSGEPESTENALPVEQDSPEAQATEVQVPEVHTPEAQTPEVQAPDIPTEAAPAPRKPFVKLPAERRPFYRMPEGLRPLLY